MFKKVASNTISQIISKGLTAIISIFLISILTKYFSQEMYWQYNKIYNYLSIFTFLADLWLYTISIREISKDKNNASKVISNVMTLRFILGILIMFFAVWIAFFLPGYDSLMMLLWILIIWFFSVISLLNSSVLSLMQSFMKMEFSLFSVVFWKIVNFLLILLACFVIFPSSLTTDYSNAFLFILWAWVIGVLVNFLLNFYYARKIANIWFEFDFDYIKYLFKTSLPYWIALFLSVVYFKVDVILLSLMEGEKISNISIAYYSLPMKIIEVLMVLAWFFLNSILPMLSTYFKDWDNENINKVLKNSFKFLLWFSVYIVVLGILFRDNIILILATPDYLSTTFSNYTSSEAFLVVLFVLLFYFVSALFNYVFIASKNEKTLLKINIFITIFNIIWNIILIPKYSFLWAWIVTLVSQILLFLFWYYYSNKITNFKLDYFYILKMFFIWTWIFVFWKYLMQNFDLWNYLNIFIYWSFLSVLYILLFYIFEFRKNKKIP